MKRIALLFANRSFGNALARAVESATDDYAVDVISGIPLYSRFSLVRRGDYDLLVADEPIGNGLLAAALARVLRVPFALVIRGWADLTNDHGEHGWLHDRSIAARTRWCLGAADESFVLSDVTRDRLGERYPVDRALTVGRPIPVSYYGSGTAQSSADEHVALTVTNLRYEGKFEGVITTLDGLLPIFERTDSFRYRIAGAGHYLDALRAYVAEYPFADRVDVLGWRDDVPALLAATDVFVYVSFLDSISTAVLEAQAAGLPIVAGDATGVPTAVGETGLLCDPTPEGITETVGRVIGDDSLTKHLAERSKAKMRTYNAHAAGQYVEAWDALIGPPRTRDERSPVAVSKPIARSGED